MTREAVSATGSVKRVDPRITRSKTAALTAVREILFAEGWAAVTHAAVAARSGVGRSTLYRHWPDVVDLLRDAIAGEMARTHSEPKGRLREDLLAELNTIRRQLHDPANLRLIRVIIERADISPSFAALKQGLYREGSRTTAEIIESGVRRGELPADTDVAFAVDQLLGPLFFRRLLVSAAFDAAYVDRVVNGYLARAS
ncbi:TetR-like C-terminal domain-containing protein [Streptomyces endophyticus]|uniref:TetR/AcrR family transcriptional regulator C-terminal ligand-binding domain-containing protein n=1 Tax=Streptomyces endophyticus TaxID=714166 RepID=A0ABU6EYM1_9ACTN|nr:TetR-like C-terminal domain-containing protein [Streptomyces endophyticus]MEB8336850.1 TetR/AcrR family transcriptional regulator C-terminal ligand-binding domain-containing protein [Streptomyces endophyticus]